LFPRFFVYVPCGDKDVSQTGFLGEPGRVVGVLVVDDRLGVGVCDGRAVVLLGELEEFRWGAVGGGCIFRIGLGNFPVLAVFAVEVAADSGDRKDRSAREEVEQGFFLDGIYVDSAGIAVDDGFELSIEIDPDPAFTALAGGDDALFWAKLALDFHGCVFLDCALDVRGMAELAAVYLNLFYVCLRARSNSTPLQQMIGNLTVASRSGIGVLCTVGGRI